MRTLVHATRSFAQALRAVLHYYMAVFPWTSSVCVHVRRLTPYLFYVIAECEQPHVVRSGHFTFRAVEPYLDLATRRVLDSISNLKREEFESDFVFASLSFRDASITTGSAQLELSTLFSFSCWSGVETSKITKLR